MGKLSQFANHVAVPLDLTTPLLQSAANLETALQVTEERLKTTIQELRATQRREDHAIDWIVILGKAHRNQSHNQVTRLFAKAKAALTKTDTPSM